MSKINHKIAYLEGLVEGLDLSNSSKEGKVIHELIDLCKIMTVQLDRLKLQFDDHEEYIEAIDDDLSLVEEFLYDENDEEVGWNKNTNMNLAEIEDEEIINSNSYDDDDNGYFEMECPNCDEIILIDQKHFDQNKHYEVLCPECDEVIIINDDAPLITSHIMDIENNKGEIHYYAP